MIGVDIIEVETIQRSIKKLGDSYLNQVFTKAEQRYCEAYKFKFERYAGRFAAKEAVAKVIKKGPRNFWLDIEVLNDGDGAPFIKLSKEFKRLFPYEIEISISHTKNYAVAVAARQENRDNS